MRIACLFLMTCLAACNPNVESGNIYPASLLSVSCIVSPQDTVFTAYVFRGSQIGSTVWPDSAAVKDALITVSDGRSFDTLRLTVDSMAGSPRKLYRYMGRKSHIALEAGTTCYLNVATSSGEVVSSTCSVPPAPGALDITGNRENDDYRFRVHWQNPALHKYFILILDAQGTYYDSLLGEVDLQPILSDEITFPRDNQVLENEYSGTLPYAYLSDRPTLQVFVRNIGLELYSYFESYQRYQQWNGSNDLMIVPNFQPMPLIPSNISGGVGIFGCYNESKVVIPL